MWMATEIYIRYLYHVPSWQENEPKEVHQEHFLDADQIPNSS